MMTLSSLFQQPLDSNVQVALITVMATLAGVALGSILTHVFASRREKARWEREQEAARLKQEREEKERIEFLFKKGLMNKGTRAEPLQRSLGLSPEELAEILSVEAARETSEYADKMRALEKEKEELQVAIIANKARTATPEQLAHFMSVFTTDEPPLPTPKEL